MPNRGNNAATPEFRSRNSALKIHFLGPGAESGELRRLARRHLGSPSTSCPGCRRTTARIVSWLTPNTLARERRLFVAASARMVVSCSAVSLRARARYRRCEPGLPRNGQRGAIAGRVRRSGKRMRQVPIGKIEDAEPIPVASANSITRSGRGTTATAVLLSMTTRWISGAPACSVPPGSRCVDSLQSGRTPAGTRPPESLG
jgi:hypothetical protein